MILLLAGIGLIAQAVTTGSFGFALLNLPLVAAGYAVLRRWRWAVGLGAFVALVYAAFWGLVATTPWRMPTPPRGEALPQLDFYSVALSITFLVALILLALASFDGSRRRDRPDV
ncbi:MAG: hypothetical protein ABI725_04860 [Chloroflexota bacterium]